jgi:ATP-dependent RNA helicase DHX37/DHR1
MGKSKKGYNWRARQIAAGTLDNSETVKLSAKIDLNDDQQNVDVDCSNTLALPSKKRKFKAASENQPIGKILSKKKRKHLEKVVDRKKKKEEREELVEKLQQVQGDPELLKKMVSISAVQTKGLKKQFAENDWQEKMQKSGVTLEQVIVNDYNADDIEMPKKIKLKKPQKVKNFVQPFVLPSFFGLLASSL